MTVYDAEDWLMRGWCIEREISAKKEQLAVLMDSVTSITAQLSGVPGSPSKDPHRKMDSYAILSGELQKEIDNLIKIQTEVSEAINAVDNEQLRVLLIERYINRKTWKDISDILHYSYDGKRVFQLRTDALKKIKDYIELHYANVV